MHELIVVYSVRVYTTRHFTLHTISCGAAGTHTSYARRMNSMESSVDLASLPVSFLEVSRESETPEVQIN